MRDKQDQINREARRRARDYEYQKARRAKAVAAGLCGVCCARPRDGSSYRCVECGRQLRDWNRALMRTRRANPARITTAEAWCDDCQACGFHRHDCITRRAA